MRKLSGLNVILARHESAPLCQTSGADFFVLPFLFMAASSLSHDVSFARAPQRAAWPAHLAGVFLLLVALPAFDLGAQASSGDCAALLFLGVCALIIGWTPLRRYFERDDATGHNATTFALMAAMFTIYLLSRRLEPTSGPALKFAWSPDESFPISYAAFLSIIGALIVAWPTWNVCSGATRAMGLALLILGVLGAVTFWFLGRFFVIGPVDVLVPNPFVHLWMQTVEFGALTVLCHAAASHVAARRWILRVLPFVLLALWARHQFAPPIVEDE